MKKLWYWLAAVMIVIGGIGLTGCQSTDKPDGEGTNGGGNNAETPLPALEAPIGLTYTHGRLSWNAVTDAQNGYTVTVIKESTSAVSVDTAETSIGIEERAGRYSASVFAKAVPEKYTAGEEARISFEIEDVIPPDTDPTPPEPDEPSPPAPPDEELPSTPDRMDIPIESGLWRLTIEQNIYFCKINGTKCFLYNFHDEEYVNCEEILEISGEDGFYTYRAGTKDAKPLLYNAEKDSFVLDGSDKSFEFTRVLNNTITKVIYSYTSESKLIQGESFGYGNDVEFHFAANGRKEWSFFHDSLAGTPADFSQEVFAFPSDVKRTVVKISDGETVTAETIFHQYLPRVEIEQWLNDAAREPKRDGYLFSGWFYDETRIEDLTQFVSECRADSVVIVAGWEEDAADPVEGKYTDKTGEFVMELTHDNRIVINGTALFYWQNVNGQYFTLEAYDGNTPQNKVTLDVTSGGLKTNASYIQVALGGKSSKIKIVLTRLV